MSTAGASPTRPWCPRSSPAASGSTRRATKARTAVPAKTTYLLAATRSKAGVLYEDVEYSNTNQRTGPTFTAAGRPPDRHRRPGQRSSPDPNFGRIYRVTRANFIVARVTTQNYWSFFAQDTWRSSDRLTVNPGIRYEEQTLVGNLTGCSAQGDTIDDFALKGNWAPRIGAVYDVLGNGRVEAVRQLRPLLRADPERPGGARAVGRRGPQPRRLLRRQPDPARSRTASLRRRRRPTTS